MRLLIMMETAGRAGRAGPTGPTIVVRKRGADRVRRGHLWVYRSDVLNPNDAEPGTIVAVRDERGVGPSAILGRAFFSSKSQISLRFLSRGDVAVVGPGVGPGVGPADEPFFRERFAAADRLRERL